MTKWYLDGETFSEDDLMTEEEFNALMENPEKTEEEKNEIFYRLLESWR